MADINVTVPDKAPVHVDWTSPDYQWSASGPTQAPAVLSESVPTIVGVFWGLVGLFVFVIANLIIWTILRRRRRAEALAAAQEDERRRNPASLHPTSDTSVGNEKPANLPIIIILPDDGVAFGWEVPSREESLDSSVVDSIDLKATPPSSDDDDDNDRQGPHRLPPV